MELTYPKKPEPLHTYEAKSRRCLKCREPFASSWPGERVCSRCKSSAVWRTSTSSGSFAVFSKRPARGGGTSSRRPGLPLRLPVKLGPSEVSDALTAVEMVRQS